MEYSAPRSENVASGRWLRPEELDAWRSLKMMEMALDAELARRIAQRSLLSLADYVVLVVLTEAPEGMVRPFALAQTVGWERSRLSHHLSRMEERGLVAKIPCPEDRRGSFVAITEEGRREIEKAAPGHAADVRALFVDLLERSEIAVVASISSRVLANLGQVATADPDCDDAVGD